ncbi:MAG: DinB family protein [Acidobacteriota bacterium]|nr:DinB family protein [Acidobacteriota bacterium]
MTNAGRPQTGEYNTYYQKYIDLAAEDDIVGALDAQSRETAALLGNLTDAQAGYRYEAGKWSIKQIVGHITDAERVFAYRVLSIARGETKPLPGFDQEPFVVNGGFDGRTISDLAEELATVRRANVMMLRALSDEAWRRIGTASESPVSVRAIAFIMLGHERHHLRIVRERYLAAPTSPRTA